METTELFDQWFRIADKDRDGKIGGAEAVEFFGRSGLGKDTLFQVWNLVAGNNQSLTKPQFYSAMRLVSLAQQNGGRLAEPQARMLLIGTVPPPPPPKMAGLDVPSAKPVAQQWAPAPSLAAPAVTPPVLPTAASGQLPPMTPADAQRYQSLFAQLDKDRDGLVQGGECYGFFLQWGLAKQTLKDVWDVVAGSRGQLNVQQFVACLYLMDLAKKGLPVPRTIPPGPFPPMASSTPDMITMDHSGRMNFTMPTYQPQVDVTGSQFQLPTLPAKTSYVPQPLGDYTSRVPALDEIKLAELSGVEQSRIASEREAALLKDQELVNVQREAEAATRKAKWYKDALAELAVFKSKTDVALLQAQERLKVDQGEADSLQQRYEDAYAGAQTQFQEGMRVRDQVAKARESREEWTAKLKQLEVDIAQISSMSANMVEVEEAATAEVQKAVAAAETKKATLENRTAALKEAKAGLEKELEALQLALTAAQAEVEKCREDLEKLQQQGAEGEAVKLPDLLKSAAGVFQQLLAAAASLKTPVPPEAVLTPFHPSGYLEYDRLALAQADEYWEDFKDEGFKVVNALPPDTRLTTPPASAPPASLPGPAMHWGSGAPTPVPSPPPPTDFGFADFGGGMAPAAMPPAPVGLPAAAPQPAVPSAPMNDWLAF